MDGQCQQSWLEEDKLLLLLLLIACGGCFVVENSGRDWVRPMPPSGCSGGANESGCSGYSHEA